MKKDKIQNLKVIEEKCWLMRQTFSTSYFSKMRSICSLSIKNSSILPPLGSFCFHTKHVIQAFASEQLHLISNFKLIRQYDQENILISQSACYSYFFLSCGSLGRSVQWSARFLGLPLLWGRYRVWFYLPSHGAPFCRVRQEIKATVQHLSSASSFHSCGRAL